MLCNSLSIFELKAGDQSGLSQAHRNEKRFEGSSVSYFKMLATIVTPKNNCFKSNDLKGSKMLNICRS